MEQVIYDKLKEVARARESTNYTEIGALVGLEPYNPDLWKILDEINQSEHQQHHPMISALVVVQGENKPGSGFWACAIRLGKFTRGEDEDRFWSDELRRVWEYWASH